VRCILSLGQGTIENVKHRCCAAQSSQSLTLILNAIAATTSRELFLNHHVRFRLLGNQPSHPLQT
jgi:hypothetical protein